MGWSSLWTAFLLPALLLLPTADSLTNTILPGCKPNCGRVEVPYPFGIGDGCFRPGFEIDCINESTPVLADIDTTIIRVLSLSVTPRPEARVMLPVAYQCYNKTGYPTEYYGGTMDINKTGVYRISNDFNELFVLGCNTFSCINSGASISGRYSYMFYTGCSAYCNDSGSAKDGACAGVGCCHVDIPPGLTDNSMSFKSSYSHVDMEFSPCDYAFLVERGNYTFKAADLHMKGNETSKPVRLDWAIRDSTVSSMSMSCAQAVMKSGYTCISNHSECVDSINGPGYFCNCTEGYEGNPYLTNGCKNINECERSREEYPCHGICHDTEGSYDCLCPSGYESKGNPREIPCNPKFPVAAQITLGTVLGTSIFIIALLSVVVTFQKRKLFRKNGGNKLKDVDSLVFYTTREVKKITRNYQEFLGKGAFGEVYKGELPDKDRTKVAVKKSAGAVTEVEKFVGEVKIQSRMIHRNVLRLKGCCLEVKCPVLVYEYAANGNLGERIHGKDGQKPPFPLEQRLDIAIGTAEGLAYMHTYIDDIIQHGDVKPDNILLDEKFVPKLSDFGLSIAIGTAEGLAYMHTYIDNIIQHGDVKPDNILHDEKLVPKLSDFGLSSLLAVGKQYVTNVIGCIGYMDPSLPVTKRLTPANDVYSFGVVLLELIARRPIEPRQYFEECGLVSEFRRAYEEDSSTGEQGNNRHRLLDKDIATQEDIPVLEGVVRLAIECIGKNRPDMTEVARRLAMLKKEWKHGMTSSQVTGTPNRISVPPSPSDKLPLLNP